MNVLLQLAILILASPHVHGFKVYKERNVLMNLLSASGDAVEEQLYMEHCKHSTGSSNCNLALDGHVINEWTQCATTTEAQQPWWLASLEAPAYITRVVIHTTELPDSSMSSGFTDFSLLVSGVQCYRHLSSEYFQSRSFPCDALGDLLTIQSSTQKGILSLCEVEAYGVPVTFKGTETGSMELSMPSCSQSSPDNSSSILCHYATDRNFALRQVNGKLCAKTEKEDMPWWAGFFPEPAMVTDVKVFAEENCCPEAFHDFVIKINDVECRRYKDKRDGSSFVPTLLSCRKFGNYVQVQSQVKKSRMSLCQIQVFGYKMLLLADTIYTYLGCFKDNPQEPDFEEQVSNTSMSPAKCHRLCKRNNKTYFGLQNGQVCMCGSKYGRHGKAETDSCSIPCKDKKDVMCGGRGFNSVYEIVL